MLIGYARVSKGDDQSTSAQLRALKDAGCERLFEEAASRGRWDRPQLLRMIDHLRPGDVVVTWKLDRLSRSLLECLDHVPFRTIRDPRPQITLLDEIHLGAERCRQLVLDARLIDQG